MRNRILAAFWAVAVMLPGLALAQEPTASDVVQADESGGQPVRHYLLGLGLSSSLDHVGVAKRSIGLQPIWGFWAGRYRLSSGRASSLWQVGRETVVDAGLSTTLIRDSDWSLGASLSWDGGRKSGDDPLLADVPDLRSTLRGKLSAGYAFAPRWSIGLGTSHDLLDHGGGGRYSAGLGYRQPLSERSYWDASLSLSWGNRIYMNSYYGIPASSSRAYQPDGGVEGLGLGWGYTAAINHDWVAYGGLNYSRLLGDAARSPVVGRSATWGASIGVAYRH